MNPAGFWTYQRKGSMVLCGMRWEWRMGCICWGWKRMGLVGAGSSCWDNSAGFFLCNPCCQADCFASLAITLLRNDHLQWKQFLWKRILRGAKRRSKRFQFCSKFLWLGIWFQKNGLPGFEHITGREAWFCKGCDGNEGWGVFVEAGNGWDYWEQEAFTAQ